MRPRIVVIRDRIDIEKHRARNMGGEIIVTGSGNTPGSLKDASMTLTLGSSRWAASQSVETSGSSVDGHGGNLLFVILGAMAVVARIRGPVIHTLSR